MGLAVNIRFSLKLLLTVVMALAVLCAVVAMHIRSQYLESDVIARLSHLNPRVEYAGDFVGLSRINTMSLQNEDGPPLTDREIEKLTYCRYLKDLSVRNVRLNNGDALHLANLTSVENLSFFGGQMSSACLSRIAQLPLRQLTLCDIEGVSDDFVNELESNRILQNVDLCNCHVTDKSIQSLLKFPYGCNIHLEGTDISTDGIQQLSKKRSDLMLFY